jgi:hypothetical protein
MSAKRGLGNSAHRLSSLGFDPIQKMAENYARLLKEIETQEQISEGTYHRLNKDGSHKAYLVDFHMDLIEKAANLAEKLLKYGYAPIKEAVEDKPVPVLHISLSDQGGTFTLGGNKDAADKPASDTE